MPKRFNTTGNCIPKRHYMVDLTSRLEAISKMVDAGQYITINRGRQYGKTTTLFALESYLADRYYVLNMDFQTQMSSSTFKDEYSFSRAFAKAFVFLMQVQNVTPEMKNALKELQHEAVGEFGMVDLFMQLITVCAAADKSIVLMIDEVDSASNNQVFLDFLAQLRGYYITRDKFPT